MYSNKPYVSVLMSVYSEPIDWVDQAIQSIIDQTFVNFEFIIVNDNPSSNLLKTYLNELSHKDERIIIITNHKNIGLTKSLNKGLNNCHGKYIARMDADDWAYPNRLIRQVEFMDLNADIVACSGLAYSWDGKEKLKPIVRPISPNDVVSYTFTSSPFIHPLLFCRRDVLDSNNITYDEDFPRSQDYKLAVDLLGIGKIANLPEYLLKYRISKQQITSKYGKEQVILCKKIRRIYINNYYKKCNFNVLDNLITVDTIQKNIEAESNYLLKINRDSNEAREFKRTMNSIRRLFYYSLTSYSHRSLMKFILSGDYFKYPYNIRRFFVILVKHFKSEFIPKLL